MLSPITGQNDTELVEVYSSRHILERWEKEFAIELSELFKEVNSIELWRCKTTGFEWYVPSEVAGDTSFYEQLQKYDWYYMKGKWEFYAALKLFDSNDKVLEIGCGFGHFLSAARNAGIQVTGAELNKAAVEKIRKAGFPVFNGTLNSLQSHYQGHFDGVCAFQVLEHVNDPIPFLRDMLALLKCRGKLVLSVPNAAVMRVIDPKRQNLLDMPPHHLSKWDEIVFKSLEKILPIKVNFIKNEPLQSYHIYWFADAFGERLRYAIGDIWGRFLINRYSLILARKLLRCGFRKIVPGHTLFVVMEKIE